MRDSKEFDEIFRLYYEQLYLFALQYVADPEECHDIVSTAYEAVWRDFERMEASTVKAYLYTTVRSKCIDFHRRQDTHSRYAEYVAQMSQTAIEAHSNLEHEEQQRVVSGFLAGLKSPTREILEACYVSGKSYQQVAEEMKISISTVKKHMVRALGLIRELKKNLKT